MRLLGHMATNNFIAENVQTLDKYSYHNKEEELHKRMSLYHERAQEAILKKEETEMMTLKRKMFLVHKWSIIRERRKEHEERMMIHNQKQLRNFSWHTMINLNEIIRTIYAKFNDVRWHIRLNQARDKAAKKIQHAFRFYMFRKD